MINFIAKKDENISRLIFGFNHNLKYLIFAQNTQLGVKNHGKDRKFWLN